LYAEIAYDIITPIRAPTKRDVFTGGGGMAKPVKKKQQTKSNITRIIALILAALMLSGILLAAIFSNVY